MFLGIYLVKRIVYKMQRLGNMILRPTRDTYDPIYDLGPSLFFINGRVFKRTDCQIKNSRNLTLQCSFFEPIGRQKTTLPCVIYCHGNCGSRLDAYESVELLLPKEISVFVFDFAGSGISEGDFVSLGY